MSQLLTQNLFRSEQTSEQEKQSTLRLLRTILIMTLVAVVAVTISEGIVSGRTHILVALLPVSLLLLLSIYLVSRGVFWPARLLIPITIFGVLTYLIAVGGGIHDVAMLAYATVLLLSCLMLGQNAALIFGVFVIIAVAIIAALEIDGVIVNEGSFITAWDEVVLISILVLATAGLLRLMLGRLNESLRRARESEQAQIEANRALRELQVGLEERVEERTRELARRTSYLEATAQIAREAAATLDLQSLLSRVVNLIGERLGLYHAGLFLLDDLGEWAELKAASSQGGKQMLARGYRLRVEDRGVVGYAVNRGLARIAHDTGDAEHPDLPETRSEMALPLQARGEILGVLDVQSTVPQAFTDEDITALQTLADQVALAISNAQLFQQVQASIEAERQAYGELSRQAWAQLIRRRDESAYRSRKGVISVLSGQEEAPDTGAERLPTLNIPVHVRGQAVAMIQARKPDVGGEWTAEESGLIEAFAEQLSVALESARLYEDTQRRAAQERLMAEVTTRVRETLDVDTVLQTAVREMRQALGLAEVEVYLEPGSDTGTIKS